MNQPYRGSPGRGATQQARGQGAANNTGAAAGNQQKNRNSWTSVATIRDPWHSDCEIKIRASLYDAGVGFTLSPVLEAKRGQVGKGDGGQMYNHSAGIMFSVGLEQCLVMRHQLRAFLDGKLRTFELRRDQNDPPHRVIAFTQVDEFYDTSTEDGAVHTGGLAICIEQWDKGHQQGVGADTTIVFIDRPQYAKLTTDGEEVAFHAGIEAILATIESYVANCARVDFASTRLLMDGGRPQQASGPTAAQPVRRGLASPGGHPAHVGDDDDAPPPSTPSRPGAPAGVQARGGIGATRGMTAPAGGGPVGGAKDVTDQDLDAALGGK